MDNLSPPPYFRPPFPKATETHESTREATKYAYEFIVLFTNCFFFLIFDSLRYVMKLSILYEIERRVRGDGIIWSSSVHFLSVYGKLKNKYWYMEWNYGMGGTIPWLNCMDPSVETDSINWMNSKIRTSSCRLLLIVVGAEAVANQGVDRGRGFCREDLA